MLYDNMNQSAGTLGYHQTSIRILSTTRDRVDEFRRKHLMVSFSRVTDIALNYYLDSIAHGIDGNLRPLPAPTIPQPARVTSRRKRRPAGR